MSDFRIRLNKYKLFLSASVVILLFSSWAGSIYKRTLIDLTGNTAFNISYTHHVLSAGHTRLAYTASTGYLTSKDKQGKPLAHIFYTAYSAEHTDSQRPVTFVFNGGPGSASIWLHMGSFGPVRAVRGKSGYQENPDSWLPFTDLVFIDPVGTGYSRPAEGIDAKRFYGYIEDIKSIAGFIKDYLEQTGRQNSRKFIAGESYGAARAVGLASYLQDSLNISVNGLTLISPALNYRLVSFRKGNDAPYTYYLPTYAITAQYHNRLVPELQMLPRQVLIAKAIAFANDYYARFLSGSDTTSAFRRLVMDSLSYFTGIAPGALSTVNGRITDRWFVNRLLKHAHQTIGIFDIRVQGTSASTDPSEQALRAVFPAAFKQYVEADLEYQNHLPYLATTNMPAWNYGAKTNDGYLDVSATLADLLQKNPDLKVQIAAGYYDLATPVGTTQYVIGHLGVSDEQKKHITINYYNAGHMIYTDNTSNNTFKATSSSFYAAVR